VLYVFCREVEKSTVITLLYKTDGGFSEHDAFKPGSWVYVEDPDDAEIEELVDTYDLSEDLIKDALDPYEIPRLETEDNMRYFYVRAPVFAEVGEVATFPVLIVISSKAVVTVSKNSLLRDMVMPDEEDEGTQEYIVFALHIVHSVLLAYTRSLGAIGKQIRRLRVYPKNVREIDVLNFVTQESVLNDYESSLSPLMDIYAKIKKQFDAHEDMVDDLEHQTEQLINACERYLKTIVNLREAYSAIATNNLNRVIRVLTALTILLTVPTIIASLFGMNVPLPLSDSPHALSIILLMTLLVSLLLYGLFRWRRWL